MPKQKTRRATAKRFKVTKKSGKIKNEPRIQKTYSYEEKLPNTRGVCARLAI